MEHTYPHFTQEMKKTHTILIPHAAAAFFDAGGCHGV